MNIEIVTSHPLEKKAYRCPNGSRFVELVDESEETWEKYAAELASKSIHRDDVEVFFAPSGNTIIGNHALYCQLDEAMQAKSVFAPNGFHLRSTEADFRRLIEHVQLFGHCIKTLMGFLNACKLSGVSVSKTT